MFTKQPLHRQVVGIACVLLFPLLLAIVISARLTVMERQAEVRGEAGSVAVTAAAYLDEYLRRLDALASVLVRHPDVIRLDAAACNRLFTEVLSGQPLLTNITLVDPDSRIHGSALPLQDGRMTQEWLRAVLDTKQPQIGAFRIGALSGKPIVTFAYPVNVETAVVGVLGMTIDLTRLQDVFAAIPLPDGSVITVVDQTGRLLARSVDALKYVGQTMAPAATGGSSNRRDVDGVERFSGDARVRRAPWTLSVGIRQSIVADRLRGLRTRNVAILAASELGSLLLGLWLAWRTSRHLNQLKSAVQRIADGDLSPVVARRMPNLELSELQDAFVTMAANLRGMRDARDRQVARERTMNDALQSLQRQVVRQERLAAVGLLASGVAHELNNPLQAIVGAAHMLERHPGLPADAMREVGFVKAQSTRAGEIIRSLNRFGSQHPGPIVDVDLREVVAEVMQLHARDEGTASHIVVRIASSRSVYASFTELEQVVLNFLVNARQAVEARSPSERHIEVRVCDAGSKVRLEVLDNGHGVNAGDEPKLFQPFFTTRAVGDGPGLGLSVSYGIVHSYGGTIGYCRNEWGGATFFFELPGVDRPNDGAYDESAVLRRTV